METNKVKYQPWTREEMALLANLMSKAFNAGKNQSEAAEFASHKLGRSKLACLSQFQSKMRGRGLLSDWALETEEKIETPADLGPDTDIDKEPDPAKKIASIQELINNLKGSENESIFEFEEVQEPVKITVHKGESTITPKILIDNGDVIVAKFKGYLITIEL